MKTYILAFCVLFISCTKEKQLPELQFISDGQEINFDCYNTSVVPFCGTQNIYSITAGDLLISIVADSLVNGKYDAGMNYWGNYTENIVVTVGMGGAQFSGKRSHGTIRHLPF